MNLKAFSLREKQNMEQALSLAIASGITTVHDLLHYLRSNNEKEMTEVSRVGHKLDREVRTELSREHRGLQRSHLTNARKMKAERVRAFPMCPACGKKRLLPTSQSTPLETIMLCWNCHYSELWIKGEGKNTKLKATEQALSVWKGYSKKH